MCYKSGFINRPSRVILNDDTDNYRVAGVEKIREEFKDKLFNGIVCQKQAYDITNTIKGRISRKDNMVEEMYHQSVLARNLLAAHLFAIIGVFPLCHKAYSDYFFWAITLSLGVVFFGEWRRKNFVYTRNIFQEYLRSKTKEDKKI